ncbi:ExeM/NucH family extracellular endonuclease [Demequina sp. NBRC 110052]|uniref:ExeM/NucH family extracellular endonuclease n=1 Tax=Demequina sp. NBRC 110052 TaxID=1570341 RepID=UPI000A06F0B0|nr:ExeM/NucH family extracellular endonuclease [Demequina sp. NBRC 110052]
MRLRALLSIGLLSMGSAIAVAAPATAADGEITGLLISEYIEGSSNNKAIEIYNGTTDTVSLEGYTLAAYNNGGTSVTNSITFTSGDSIAPGGTYVVYNASADPALKVTPGTDSTVTYYNGDDAVVLSYTPTGGSAIVVDSIGQVGFDPGAAWAVAGTTGATGEHTMVRNASVCAGDTDPSDVYAPSTDDWTVYAQDTFDYIGSHSTSCAAGAYVAPAGDGGEPTGPEELLISEIQGSGEDSPYKGEIVTTTGVVVGDYQGQGGDYQLSGYFIQSLAADEDDDPATSEGLFVYDYSPDVELGDVVTITGTIDEYNGLTQIKWIDSEDVIIDGTATVAPTQVTLPQPSEDYFERYEGMLVTFEQTLTVSDVYDLYNYGEITLSANGRLWNPTSVADPGAPADEVRAANLLNMLVLDDASAKSKEDIVEIPFGIGGDATTADNPLRAGATVSGLTGVMSYAFNDWRLYSNGSLAAEGEDNTASFVDSNPRPTEAPEVGGDLTVASFNMLNFFATLGYDAPLCGPEGDENCRGADDEAQYALQLAKHVEAITMLDADIVGVMEIENTVDVEALDGLVDAVNDALGEDRYAVLDTGVIGTDVIKVGAIYDQTTVEPTGDFAILDSSVDARFDDDRNRPALAQTFTEIATGESLTIVVNHLKSKGSACDEPGEDTLAGNCDQTRTAAAEALVDWANDDPTGTGEDRVLMLGDYNAYEQENPIDVITGAGFTSLVAGGDYSYVYFAEWGQLDYAFASDSLVGAVTGAAHLHINADEASDLQYYGDFPELAAGTAYRSSDHDPVLVGLSLVGAPLTVTTPAGTFFPGQSLPIKISGNVPQKLLDLFASKFQVGVASTYQKLADITLGSGEVTVQVTLPESLEPGTHHIQVRAADGQVLAEAEIEVLAEMPQTGADPAIMVLLTVSLLAAGAALVRRRMGGSFA